MAEQIRRLSGQEQALAQSVYERTLPYDRIFISDWQIGDTPVTLAGVDVADGRFSYRICWPDGLVNTMRNPDTRATLIHELCHVWQGHHGVWPTVYMGQSIVDQVVAGAKDIWRKGEYRRWDEHRAGAYTLHGADWGRNWTSFGVEQQASIVESWFMSDADRRQYRRFGPGVVGGNTSPFDARFPYIRDNIRAGRRSASYEALVSVIAPGGDAKIKAMQEKLVALGYLDSRYADGLVGRSHSATLDAVAKFQRANGLVADRDLGGPHSWTRAALDKPVSELIPSR